uniref:Uncharacterized protein n=1 Tax=Meloidogyne enterolobii TaxID=390850 RepID=A0A6V7UN28_MELEN|nr:unnamed protein product [Meloidogyne enterolobii]
MTEEGSSNSTLKSKVDDNFWQIKSLEKKTINLEGKNFLNENRLEEIEKKILNLNFSDDYKKEIVEQMEQKFQQLFEINLNN